jgi:hypothetical protein
LSSRRPSLENFRAGGEALKGFREGGEALEALRSGSEALVRRRSPRGPVFRFFVPAE